MAEIRKNSAGVTSLETGSVDSALRAARVCGYETAREDVQALVPRTAQHILELGCSTGALGAALKARQEVTILGVELFPEYAKEAEDRLDRVVVSDIDSFLGKPAPDEAPFDCLIAADVLEHLVDPWGALARSVHLLGPGATVVISLPNVLHAGSLWRLVREGRWPLDDAGIFDRTHLRWFTRDDATELLRQAGLRPIRVEPRHWTTSRRHRVWRWALYRAGFGRFLPEQYVLSAVKDS